MRARSLILSVTLGAAVLAGCGGSSKQPATGSSGPSTSAPSVPAAPPPGILGRVLTSNELPGFSGSPGRVDNSVASWEAASGVPAAQRAADEKQLVELGFVRGVQENLSNGSAPGLSLVEQFKTPKGARAEEAARTVLFKKVIAGQGTYTAFAVPGIPGALGYGVVQGGQGGINVAFTKGAYYYLEGEDLAGQGVKAGMAGLVAAAQRLYRRVSP